MSERVHALAGGGRVGPLHFLRPSWGKAGCAMSLFMGIAVVLSVTISTLFWCSRYSFLCFGLGLCALHFLQRSVDITGGWPWGVVTICVITLALSYLLVCLWARPAHHSSR